MVSIADVARHAGVSPTTVSHALSGKRPVSAEAVARVKQAMKELGYVPSRSARNLARGRTQIIGLLIPDIANGFFAELARGVEEIAMDKEYNVLLAITGWDHEREMRCLEMIQSRAVDGIIYAAGAPPTESDLARVLGGIPVVLVDEDVPGVRVDSLVSDNHQGGQLAAMHLRDLGHAHAVVLTGPEGLESSNARVAGFLEVWEAAGLTATVERGDFTEATGLAAVERHHTSFRDGAITAVFAANDLMALGALDALRDAGIGVPDEVSVIGFDDIGAARYARPRLTTVRQDVARLGRGAATALLERLTGLETGDPRRSVIPVELKVRETTAANRRTTGK